MGSNPFTFTITKKHLGIPAFEQIKKAHDKIRPWIHKTPVLCSSSLNNIFGAELYFKWVKIEAVKGYGAEIILCRPNVESRQLTLDEVVSQTGAAFIHP